VDGRGGIIVFRVDGVVDIVGRCGLGCELCDDRWASTIFAERSYIQQVERRYDDQWFVFVSCGIQVMWSLECVVKSSDYYSGTSHSLSTLSRLWIRYY